tara:strand:+ start:543 stop:644 length:102 start_codon:yes stop_codon:yes gene_type:complete
MDSFAVTALAVFAVQIIGFFILFIWSRNERKEN